LQAAAGACRNGHRNVAQSPSRRHARSEERLTDEQRDTVSRHLEDAYRIAFAKNFTHRSFSEEEREERRRLAENGLIKAVLRFDPLRECSFRTYLYRTIRFTILDANVSRKAKKNSQKLFTDLEDEE
jgi:DNA-directed RNA polymerase specialized sigma subunit